MFDELLNQSTEEQSLFSVDLWRDDYERPSEIAIDTKTAGFAALYQKALAHFREPLLQLEEYRICTYCNTSYLEKDNIGKHRCAYHPFSPRDGEFPCCQKRDLNGCTACDHDSGPMTVGRWSNENFQIRIPKLLRNIVMYPESSIAQTVDSADVLYSYDIVNRVAQRV